MSQPAINSPAVALTFCSVLPGSRGCCHRDPTCCLLHQEVDCCSRTSLQKGKLPLSVESLIPRLLTPGSFFGLEAGQAQGLQARRVQSKLGDEGGQWEVAVAVL